MTPFSLLLLSAGVFFTSTLTGILGFGGGLLLIAILPWFLPLAAIIPLHGVTQLVSNGSRAYADKEAIAWEYLWPFVMGSLVGVAMLASVAVNLPERWLPLFIGVFLLGNLWLPTGKLGFERLNNMALIGAVQSGFGLIIGTTGPLTMGILLRHKLSKNAVVSTNAVLMALSHGFKVILFVGLAFPFEQYWLVLVLMTGFAITGTWLGKRLRHRVSEAGFAKVSTALLTLIGLQLLVQPWL